MPTAAILPGTPSLPPQGCRVSLPPSNKGKKGESGRWVSHPQRERKVAKKPMRGEAETYPTLAPMGLTQGSATP